jgi:hypothetical protein
MFCQSISLEDPGTLITYGKAAAGKVLEISEDEFNALANKHGGEVEKIVEVINVPGSSSDMDWQNIPIGEVVDWTPLSSDDSGEWQSLCNSHDL